MKIELFEELLDQYGWDLQSWPEDLRQDANILISENEDAAALLKALRVVEDILADDPLPMGKHSAIDDIFDAIDVAEERRAVADDDDLAEFALDPDSLFHALDDRPKSRAHLSVASSGPDDSGSARKTYPTASSASPVMTVVGRESRARARSTGHRFFRVGRDVVSGIGMVVCVLAGFIFGVMLTAQQGQQVAAQADEIPIADAFEEHFYDLDGAVPVSHAANKGGDQQ